jgi:NAD dependent epimerase/dehydratase family enzyme
VVLGSQKVLPKRLLDAGFKFAYPTLPQALADIYSTPAKSAGGG